MSSRQLPPFDARGVAYYAAVMEEAIALARRATAYLPLKQRACVAGKVAEAITILTMTISDAERSAAYEYGIKLPVVDTKGDRYSRRRTR